MIDKLVKIKQNFPNHAIDDVLLYLQDLLKNSKLNILPGSKIAIAVGSRGINNLPLIVKTLGEWLVDLGAHPFVVPAMGSHGGATALGQVEILNSLGIDEKAMGMPICSSMKVVELEQEGTEFKAYMDEQAYLSDGVILINRIKPHTDFKSDFESGLVKMATIGLGNHKQAQAIHRLGVEGLKNVMPQIAKIVFDSEKIIMGVGIVEDGNDETAVIKCLPTSKIFIEEPLLLKKAKDYMPSLPTDEIDILIVDQIGKNISGTGLDPNIIGRIKILGELEPKRPKIKIIIVDDVTAESHGNAIGIGLADIITKKLYDKINYQAMYENVLTSTFIERAKVPLVANDLNEAFKIAKSVCGLVEESKLRVVRINNTLDLSEVEVSKSILESMSN